MRLASKLGPIYHYKYNIKDMVPFSRTYLILFLIILKYHMHGVQIFKKTIIKQSVGNKGIAKIYLFFSLKKDIFHL